MKKKIKVWGCTPFALHIARHFLDQLANQFDFVETRESPDFIFVHAADRHILAYEGVRILLTGENLIPDFNIIDYGVGFSEISFGDRYIRWPVYCWLSSLDEFESNRRKALQESPPLGRLQHCACVVSNVSNRQGPFAELVDALEQYQGVTQGGQWRNNIGGRVKDKEALLRKHKFSIAFENAAYPGYTTEKITDALMAGTIPIYWGDPCVDQHINPKSFVEFKSSDTVESVMAKVKAIDSSPELYTSMLNEPIFTEKAKVDLEQEKILEFFRHIFSQPRELAYRRNRSRWGIKYEKMLYRTYFKPLSQLARLPKMLWAGYFKA